MDAIDLNAYINERIKANTFLGYIGLVPTYLEKGRIQARLPMRKELTQQDGFAHGGVIASVLDMVAGFASYSLLEPPLRCLTVEIKVSYFYPCTQNELLAEGWVCKQGSRLHFCESVIYDIQNNEKVILAKATATMAIV